MNSLLILFFLNFSKIIPDISVACSWHSSQRINEQTSFVISLSQDNQEIENQYLDNPSLYARVLQYLNYDVAQDVSLRLPGQPDSITAIAASYPRQYGSTGRSSVLLVFPVPDQQLRNGCHITFRGDKLALGTRHFLFTAQDIQTARKASSARK